MTARAGLAALLLYVLPLALTAIFLASVGLGLLALGLLVVEAAVVTAVALVRRRTRGPARPVDGSMVLLGLGGVVLAVVVLLVVLRATSG